MIHYQSYITCGFLFISFVIPFASYKSLRAFKATKLESGSNSGINKLIN